MIFCLLLLPLLTPHKVQLKELHSLVYPFPTMWFFCDQRVAPPARSPASSPLLPRWLRNSSFLKQVCPGANSLGVLAMACLTGSEGPSWPLPRWLKGSQVLSMASTVPFPFSMEVLLGQWGFLMVHRECCNKRVLKHSLVLSEGWCDTCHNNYKSERSKNIFGIDKPTIKNCKNPPTSKEKKLILK